MALVLQDRVREISTTTGDGTVTLSGVYPGGYRTFASCVSDGSTVYYCIHNTTNGVTDEWEVGLGTYSSNTLTRTTVYSSSSGGGKIVFSAGDKEVFITQPSERAVYEDASGNVLQNQFTSMNVTGTATINVATLTSGTISTSANNATDIVNRAYVDNAVAAGIHFHEPVRVEAPTALSAAYNNGTAGVGATLTNSGTNAAIQVDGVSLNVTDRVLVYTQSNATHNGVYVVSTQGAPDSPGPGAKWVLTRSDDTDTFVTDSPEGLSQGSTFFVQQGNTGAGETYTCNTLGTIVFGTTDITFVQVSSAQIYSAGTGLNLNSTTFSIANTTVTPATYGTASQVPQVAINAQGQITSASNVNIAITASNVSGLATSATTDTTNADNITSGTLNNARTTASASNGASTIVARDASGNFAANTITANLTGNVTGNTSGSAGSLATAQNISISGGATAANVSFDGTAAVGLNVTAMNASVINSGTIPNGNTTASASNGASTIVARDVSGNFTANNVTATNIIAGGSFITSLNASIINSGVIGNAFTTAASANGASTIVARDASGNFAANVITANGSSLTTLNATAITTGTLDNARTSAASANGASTIVARDASGNFAANVGTFTTVSGAGGSVTAINASNISTGTLDNARTTAASANGASTIIARDASGNFTANVATLTTVTGDGSGITALNGTAITTGTVANARTTAASANGASTIVARDASGNFSAGTITASLTGNASGSAATFTATNQNSQFNSVGVGTAGSGTAGEIRATNNITAYYSDDRLKNNLGNIPNALALVKTLNGFYYEANQTAVDLGYEVKREVGVSAQQVQAIMPEVVAPAPIDEKYLTVRYERLVPLLIEAIKELEAQVAELKAK
jgi:hypothetical protein